MQIKVDLETIKQVGLNPAILFSYLNDWHEFRFAIIEGANIKPKEFFNVKLKDIEKELGMKRVSLKNAICQLEKEKYIQTEVEKKGIFRNVRFKILRNEKPQNADVLKYINTASKPLKTDVLKCTVDENADVLKCDVKHKHTAPSIYSYIIKNNNILKATTNPSGVVVNSNVRKKVLSLLGKTEGIDKKETTSASFKKPPLKLSEPKMNTKVKVSISKREKDTILAQEILKYLNSKTGKKFKVSAESNLKNIRGRISEGFSLEDFKIVIDKKTSQWDGLIFSNGQPASNYLRPITLFASKNFENYLNEETVGGKTPKGLFKNNLDRDLFNFFQKMVVRAVKLINNFYII